MKLIEYLNSKESSYWDDDFKWTMDILKSKLDFEGRHLGDCNNNPCTCDLCSLKGMLDEYEEYCREKKLIK